MVSCLVAAKIGGDLTAALSYKGPATRRRSSPTACGCITGTVNLRSCGRSANHISLSVTRDLVNRGGEPADIAALGLQKLTMSTDYRDDLSQVVIAMAVTRDGIPV